MIDLKKQIKKRGYTLTSIATTMGVTKNTISNIVNGNPTLANLIKVADAIGCSVSDLLTDNKDDTNTQHLICPHCGAELCVKIEKKPQH